MATQVETFISADGNLDVSCLRSLPLSNDQDDDLTTIITSFSAYGLGQSELINDVFETTFPTSSSSNNPIVSYTLVPGHDSAIMAEAPRHLAILNAAPFDSPGMETNDDYREMAWNVCLSLSNVVLFVVRMHDLARPQSNGIDGLRASLTQLLLFHVDGIVPAPTSTNPRKRALLVIVKDYEADVISKDEIVAGFLQEMQTVYASVTKPPRAPSRISDLLEFEFSLVPSKLENDGNDYTKAIQLLQSQLIEPTSDEYLFENGTYSVQSMNNVNTSTTASASTGTDSASSAPTPSEIADGTWKKMEKDRMQDVPPKEDLMSAFDCDNAMRKVYEKYERSVKPWKRETEGGVIVENFGEHASKLYKDTISVYDDDALPHKRSKAFRRKRDELIDLLNADLYSLFVIQIAKLRETSYQSFKDNLDEIDDQESKLDKLVKSTLKDSQKDFQTEAGKLLPDFASWRFDSDFQRLSSQMNDDSTDKLQRARIADVQEGNSRRNRRRAAAIAASATPKRRQPISLGIHYLDPSPFGFKDSRYEKLGSDDNMQFRSNEPVFGGGGRGGGLSVPLAPSRGSDWHRANQDFVFSEKK